MMRKELRAERTLAGASRPDQERCGTRLQPAAQQLVEAFDVGRQHVIAGTERAGVLNPVREYVDTVDADAHWMTPRHEPGAAQLINFQAAQADGGPR